MPGGCDPAQAPPEAPPGPGKETAFGYFGALAAHAGILPLAEAFARSDIPGCAACVRVRTPGAGDPRTGAPGSPDPLSRAARAPVRLPGASPKLGCAGQSPPGGLGQREQLSVQGVSIRDDRPGHLDDPAGRGSTTSWARTPFTWRTAMWLGRLPGCCGGLPRRGRADLMERGRRLRARVLERYSWGNPGRADRRVSGPSDRPVSGPKGPD